jgi:hypothetical protein
MERLVNIFCKLPNSGRSRGNSDGSKILVTSSIELRQDPQSAGGTRMCRRFFSVEGHVFNQPVLGGYYGSEVYGDLPAAPGRCDV